jgi:hypothetical protein
MNKAIRVRCQVLILGLLAATMISACNPGLIGGEPTSGVGVDPISYFAPGNLFTESVVLGNDNRPGTLDGFEVSDVHLTYQGSCLPEGVLMNEVYLLGEEKFADSEENLSSGYEYYFIDFTVTNKSNSGEHFSLDSNRLSVIGNENELFFAQSSCYRNGHDMINTNDATGFETVRLNDTEVFKVAFVMNQKDIDTGDLYFVPDTSPGQSIGAPYLPYQAIRVESLAAQ